MPQGPAPTVPAQCCAFLVEPLTTHEAHSIAAAFAALADPVRLKIINLLARAPGGEVCACNLVKPLRRSQPTVSHHLRVLSEAGLIEGRRDGRWVSYRVNEAAMESIRDSLGPAI